MEDFWDPLVRRAVFLCLTFVPAAASANAGTLPPPVNLSSSRVGGGQRPMIAVDAKGNINVAFWQLDAAYFLYARSMVGHTLPHN
jgi:hypothetical protein